MRSEEMDVQQIKQKYRRNARFYDVIERPFRRFRERALDRLNLRPGEAALDFGCGTGLSFDLLEQAVGPQGHIIGVELSPDMLMRARQKIDSHGWTNITLIEGNAEEVDLAPESVDAVLCYYTHDIMHSERALARAVNALRPGGRFVTAGAKRASGLAGLLINPLTRAYSLPFVTNLSGTARPWAHLEHLMGPLEVDERLWGSGYVARGVKRAAKEAQRTEGEPREVEHGS